MLVGVYGDVHLTKNMRNLQDTWNTTAIKSIYHMYDKFDELSVESVVCLGDFFDAPKIEANHMQLVLPILKHINERTYPTYLLLGNHEIDRDDSNILDFLSMYDNIIPVTTLTEIESLLFIPYNEDPTGLEYRADHIVFTHHDIYGSELAGGKTKAFFGIDPDIFQRAMLVLNGHVHLKSIVRSNVLNAGSLLVSSQGELKVGEYPEYYTVDTRTGNLDRYKNIHSMIYLTSHVADIDKIASSEYDSAHLVLRVEYQGDLPENMINSLHTSYRKLIDDISDEKVEDIHHSNFDLKNYLTDYLKRDDDISDEDKEDYINTGMELLS